MPCPLTPALRQAILTLRRQPDPARGRPPGARTIAAQLQATHPELTRHQVDHVLRQAQSSRKPPTKMAPRAPVPTPARPRPTPDAMAQAILARLRQDPTLGRLRLLRALRPAFPAVTSRQISACLADLRHRGLAPPRGRPKQAPSAAANQEVIRALADLLRATPHLGRVRLFHALKPRFPWLTAGSLSYRLSQLRASGHVPPPGMRPSRSALPAANPGLSLPKVRALRAQGLSHRAIGTRLRLSRQQVDRLVQRDPALWASPDKRAQECSILARMRAHLGNTPGTVLALTSTQLADPLLALGGPEREIVAIEKDSGIVAAMVPAAIELLPTLPAGARLRVVRGEFWDLASRLPGPIAALYFDAMGTLPADLPGRLTALADRLAPRVCFYFVFGSPFPTHPGDPGPARAALAALQRAGFTFSDLILEGRVSATGRRMSALLACGQRMARAALPPATPPDAFLQPAPAPAVSVETTAAGPAAL